MWIGDGVVGGEWVLKVVEDGSHSYLQLALASISQHSTPPTHQYFKQTDPLLYALFHDKMLLHGLDGWMGVNGTTFKLLQ